jgi:hypothetical protein
MIRGWRIAPFLILLSLGLLGYGVPGTPGCLAAQNQVDHVIVSVGDLEEGMALFEERTGVRPVFGGEHPGRGTRNALVSLGPRLYLELLAPQEGAEMPGLSDLAEPMATGWAASTTHMEGTLQRLDEGGYSTGEPIPGSRATPSGGLLEWRAGVVEGPLIRGAPFFIEWSAASPHPATTSPGGCTLDRLTVATPDAEALGRLVNLLGLGVTVVNAEGPAPTYEVRLRCPSGEVVF